MHRLAVLAVAAAATTATAQPQERRDAARASTAISNNAVCRESATSAPTGEGRWARFGTRLDADQLILGQTIVAYQVQWSSGAWSGWYVPGKNDVDRKPNNDGSQRRMWSYFADHNFKYIACTLAQPAPPPAPPLPPRPTPAPAPVPPPVPPPVEPQPAFVPAQLIEACGKAMVLDRTRRQCAEVAIANRLAPDIIQACARHHRMDATKLACVTQAARLLPATSAYRQAKQAPALAIDACGAAFALDGNRVKCVETSLAGAVFPDAITGCGKAFSLDGSKLACLRAVAARPLGPTAKFANPWAYVPQGPLAACAAAFYLDSDRTKCADTAMRHQLEAPAIETCSRSYRGASERHACLALLAGS